MIAAEKLRALCQQLPAYERQRGKARARDFFDIAGIRTRGVDLESGRFLELLGNMFQAKSVPLELLWQLRGTKEFHRSDWVAVEAELGARIEGSYDSHFDAVMEVVDRLLEKISVYEQLGSK